MEEKLAINKRMYKWYECMNVYKIIITLPWLNTMLLALPLLCSALLADKTQVPAESMSQPTAMSFQQDTPKLQEKADYWLQIKVDHVEKSDNRLTAKATVVNTYKVKDELAADSVITISYDMFKQPTKVKEGSKPRPMVWLPPLAQGQVTHAFLNKDEETDIFKPAASMWSFAPPVGLGPEAMQKAGMHTPQPPAPPTQTAPPKIPQPEAPARAASDTPASADPAALEQGSAAP